MYARIVYTFHTVFEWDEAKNERNISKHGIGFTRASRVFQHAYLRNKDDRYDYGEQRYLALGESNHAILVVVYTERKDRIRIISARPANNRERKLYLETTQ